MLIAYWAAKGGSGASVLAAAHALRSATTDPTLLVDLDGDLPRVLAAPAPPAGVAEWSSAGTGVPADALDRISTEIGPNLHLLGRGRGDLDPDRAAVLADLLAGAARTVVVDCGSRPGPAAQAVARAADRSVLVTRACYLAVQRFREIDLAPTEIALVIEDQRSLTPHDIEEAIGSPVRTRVRVHPRIAKAVDCGLLATRLPPSLAAAFGRRRTLRRAS